MQKRTFLKTAGIATAASFLNFESLIATPASPQPYTLPALPYAPAALEPAIDARTMEIHHSKHHQAYVTKLNEALAQSSLLGLALPKLMAQISSQPAAVRNHGGGHYNHSFFWQSLAPVGGLSLTSSSALAKAITKTFGSFASMQEQFAKAAADRFGSGWAWLAYDSKAKQLFISSTPNQDNPLMDIKEIKRGQPILALDVWEHAYYLKYQNLRKDYIAAFWSVINWPQAEAEFANLRS